MNTLSNRPTQSDLVSSLVVFIVAVPLSLGIAMASGAPAASGLITGILGGIICGLLAGAPLAVTGPAAGLTAMVFQFVQEFGLGGLAAITFLAGLIQVTLGIARAGKLVELVPKPVLEGMLTAIGFLILFGQAHVLFGQNVPQSLIVGLKSLPGTVSRSLASDASIFSIVPIVGCGMLAIAVQLVWPKMFPKIKWIPAALPAVVLATLLSLAWEMPRVSLSPLLPTMEEQAKSFLAFSWVTQWMVFLPAAFGLAAVASAESLLSARAIDSLAAQKYPGASKSNLNRELFAQGITNSLAGILGGLPCTGVIVRSAVNLDAGARSRWSTVMHGIWIAAFVMLLPWLLAKIPLTALASVLVLTGIKLLNIPKLTQELQHDPRSAGIWITTSVLIVSTDLLKGLLISLALVIALGIWDRVRTSMAVGAQRS